MRKIFVFLPLILLLLFVPSVSAQNRDSKKVEVTTLASDKVIDRNYFAANERVEVYGTVNGDAFVAGGVVDVNGTINGDLIAAGGEVKISGNVSDDVRVAGGNITISGKIGKSLTVAGGNVVVTEGATIGGSVVALGGNVTLAAPIKGTINAGVGNLNIENTVGGDVEAGVGSLRVTSKAKINGDLTYWSDTEASIDKSAEVTGNISRQEPPVKFDRGDQATIFGVLTVFAFAVKLINLLTWFLLGLLTLHFLPNLFSRSIENLKAKPWPSLGIGFLALVLVPLLAVTIMVFIIGIPLGLISLTLWFIAVYVARIPTIYFLGEWLMSRTNMKQHQVWALVIGLIVYAIVTIIPFVGWLVSSFTVLFGLGALLIAKKDIYSEARSKNII